MGGQKEGKDRRKEGRRKEDRKEGGKVSRRMLECRKEGWIEGLKEGGNERE